MSELLIIYSVVITIACLVLVVQIFDLNARIGLIKYIQELKGRSNV